MRGRTKFRDTRDFTNHRAGGGGGGRGDRLDAWKKRGSIEVWIHMRPPPVAVYRHTFPTVVVLRAREEGDTPATRVFSKDYVCHESESTLGSQYFVDRDTGERKKPSERCGLCKLVDWCRKQVALYEETRGGEKPQGLPITEPIFRFEADEEHRDDSITMHVGGLFNAFRADKMTDAQKEDVKRAKLKIADKKTGAWRENAYARCQYVINVVDDAHPENGVRVATESSSLTDAMKERINEELDDGVDIAREPFAVKWIYKEEEQDLRKKYACRVVRNKKPSQRVMHLLRGKAPEIPDDLATPFNQQIMRAVLEKHCLLAKGVVPWDELFPTREQEARWRAQDEADAAAEEAEEADAEEEHPARAKGAASSGDVTDEDDDEDDDAEDDDAEDDDEDGFACEKCGKPIGEDDPKCLHCGYVYDADAVAAEEAKKVAAKPEAKAEKPTKVRRAAAPTKAKPHDDFGDDLPETTDDLPF